METTYNILNVQDITRQSSVSTLGRSKKKALLKSLDELGERMPSLLEIDQPCAQRQIADGRRMVEVHVVSRVLNLENFLEHFSSQLHIEWSIHLIVPEISLYSSYAAFCRLQCFIKLHSCMCLVSSLFLSGYLFLFLLFIAAVNS